MTTLFDFGEGLESALGSEGEEGRGVSLERVEEGSGEEDRGVLVGEGLVLGFETAREAKEG